MAGQESFGSMDGRSQHLMAHTPTTSSMLAALQHDSFGSGSLDPSGATFNPDAYTSMSYMDTSAAQDDGLGSGHHQSGLSFSDFNGSGNTFDVSSFNPQELGLSASTPASESEHESEPVKLEQQSTA